MMYKVTIGHEKNVPFINVYIDKKRYRFWNGKSIDTDLESRRNAELLKSAFELKLMSGWRPKRIKKTIEVNPLTVKEAIQRSIQNKIENNYSSRYIKDAKRILMLWCKYETKNYLKNLSIEQLEHSHLRDFIIRPEWSPKTQLTIKSTLGALLAEYKPNLIRDIKLKKPTSSMHKAIVNVELVFKEIELFNDKLHLCCLMTYGCLLRPHREIRELTWADFSDDLSHIHLSGNRNKSGRNRIVPVPAYIRKLLVRGEPNHNIFSGNHKPYNEDYFKTLWSRFKKTSTLLDEGQTLYSFRHTGAIDIFERTGSITKLQKAMGHSSINVSLTYLRGLEVAELTEEDMPVIKKSVLHVY